MEIKIKYDGTYPNLCSGSLVVTIEGSEIKKANKEWIFPSYCLSSGGSIERGEDWDMWAVSGPWTISSYPEDFPKDLKHAVEYELNESITHGCCGGCI